MKFCIKCGEAIPDDCKVCPLCNASLETPIPEKTVIYASQADVQESIQTEQQTLVKKNKKVLKILLPIIAVALVAVTIFIVIKEVGKANLKKDLNKTWYATSDSIVKVLEIDDDKIEYSLQTGYSWLDTKVAEYKWKAIDSNHISVNITGDSYMDVEVKLSEDKKAVTFYPALTSVDPSEMWVDIGR